MTSTILIAINLIALAAGAPGLFKSLLFLVVAGAILLVVAIVIAVANAAEEQRTPSQIQREAADAIDELSSYTVAQARSLREETHRD